MSMHQEIMNIPVPKSVIHNLEHPDCKDMFSAHSYKIGHRDARHAAAELSLKAEARIEELEEMLKWYIEEDEIHEGYPENQYWIDGKHKAMKLLGVEIEE
jgi:hypothetical protein